MFIRSAHTALRSTLWLCLLALLACLPDPALARDGELRIATVELGMCGHKEEGRPTGFCFELGNLLAQAAGLEPVNRLVPLARGLDEIAGGTADMIILAREGGIEELAEDIGEVKSITMVAWARAQTPLRDIRELGGMTVAVIRGSRHERDQARQFKFIPFPCKNHELGFKLLMAGRVSAVLGPLQGLVATAERIGLQRRYLGEPLILEHDIMRVYISRQLPAPERDRLRAALNRLREDGTIARLQDRYPL